MSSSHSPTGTTSPVPASPSPPVSSWSPRLPNAPCILGQQGRVQSFPDMSKQQRAAPPIEPLQQRDSTRSFPTAASLSSPASPASLRSSNLPPHPTVSISHVPRPRFNSFSHHGEDDNREAERQHVAFSTYSSSAIPPRISPSLSPGTSPSGQSPLLGRSPGALSFNEKRKIAREQAKEAKAAAVSSSSPSPIVDGHIDQHRAAAPRMVHWAAWRQRFDVMVSQQRLLVGSVLSAAARH